MDLQAQGPVSAIERAFNVRMGVYQHPTENRTFYAPNRQPTVGLPFPLWHISGLDNYSIPQPRFVKKSDYANATGINPQAVPNANTGSGPEASFLGSDMRAAYYGGTALTGAGQNLGLLEYLGTDLDDLNTYYSSVGQTNHVPITLLSTDGTSTGCDFGSGCDDTEQTLDMTQALGMAPGLASLVMYIGSTDTAILGAMTAHNPLPTTIGCSWGWMPADPATLNPYFQKMAAQGQNFFTASGDSSTWTPGNYPWPAEAAYIVSVGGTSLNTARAGGAWQSETAWEYSGGGISPDLIPIPSWQQLSGVINSNNRGSTTYRNGPDVSANSDFTFYVCADQTTCTDNEYGGTSFAAPMWAGYLALVNQQAVANGNALLGFINPAIYSLALGSGYGTDFHDVTRGSSGSYSAVTGYDLVTGWGSPNGTGLINALAGLSTSANFTISASPTSVSVAQGSSGTSTITTTVSGGFSSSIGLSATGQPAGVTVAFSPASIAAPGAGTSTMTMTVASTTVAGTYSITVTGTGGGLTETSTVSLTVTASPNFTISASPTSVSVAQGSSGTSTITTTVSGGFSASIGLSATGQPAGVTVAFGPASIAAPGAGTSTMTMTVASTTVAGTYSITVTGTGGSLTHTSTVSLTVTAVSLPDFTISASPSSRSVTQGAQTTYTVTTGAISGFTGTVALRVSGLPSGVTAIFNPTSITGSGTSTLTLTASATASTGTVTLTIAGTSGALAHSATPTLTVTGAGPAPDFTVSVAPASRSTTRGSSATYGVTVSPLNGFTGTVTLSVSGLPTGALATLKPGSLTSGASALTVTAGQRTILGTYTLTIKGTSGSLSHTSSVTLIIH
jgi:subtilase family serine protease